MSNTGSDGDDFLTETKCANQFINISLLMQLEDVSVVVPLVR
jgi:hypothetical protein